MKNILTDDSYPIRTLEAEHAEKMFRSFVEKGLNYDMLLKHPDFMVYPSAYTLSYIIDDLINGIIEKNDYDNFIVYGILTAIDPFGDGHRVFSDRCHALKSFLNKSTYYTIYRFLEKLEHDLPINSERFQRIVNYWQC